MASMSQGQMLWAFLSIFLCFVSLGLMCASIGTNSWVQTSKNMTDYTEVTDIGLWKICISEVKSDGWVRKTCSYRELIDSADKTTQGMLQMRLDQCFVIFVCLSAFVQLITHLILLCGVPDCCSSLKKTHLFFIVAVTQLLAVLLGIVGCICFIALQDELYKTTTSITLTYQWSFMLAWISVGLCLIESGIFVVLVKVCFDNVFQSGKFNYYSMWVDSHFLHASGHFSFCRCSHHWFTLQHPVHFLQPLENSTLRTRIHTLLRHCTLSSVTDFLIFFGTLKWFSTLNENILHSKKKILKCEILIYSEHFHTHLIIRFFY